MQLGQLGITAIRRDGQQKEERKRKYFFVLFFISLVVKWTLTNLADSMGHKSGHDIAGWNQDVSLTGFSSEALGPYLSSCSCWQILVPCLCRTEIQFSCWLSFKGHSHLLEATRVSWYGSLLNMAVCIFKASRRLPGALLISFKALPDGSGTPR